MKKFLLFFTTLGLAASGYAQTADVVYEFVGIGTKTDNSAIKFSPGNGLKLTEKEGVFEGELATLDLSTNGFKIVSNDKDEMDKVGKAGLSNPGQWHTQLGHALGGSLLNYEEDASPVGIVSFYDQVSSNGYTPCEMGFKGGVQKLKDVKITYIPATKTLKVSGTPTAYWTSWQIFTHSNATTSAWVANLTQAKDDEGNVIAGVFKGTYDFGETEKEISFNLQTPKARPAYGATWAANAPAAISGTRSDETATYQLSEYGQSKNGYRSSFSASTVNKLIPPVKIKASGSQDFEFNVNTGVLKVTPTPEDIPTGISAVCAEDAPMEYYNLQGVKVENAKSGLYIVRKGNKSYKVMIR